MPAVRVRWPAASGHLDSVILQEEGLGDPAAYTAIVRAIGNGHVTFSRIADASWLKLDP